MIDVRTKPLLYNLREYSNLKAQQLAGRDFPTGGLYNGEWMTFGLYTKGTQYKELGVFSRKDLAAHLLSLYSSGGEQKHIISDNIQMALLAGVERALFHRMQTPARSLAHAAARHSGMGTENLSIFDSVQDKLDNLE